MDLAIKIFANDKTVRSDTVQDLKTLRVNFYQLKPEKENNSFL